MKLREMILHGPENWAYELIFEVRGNQPLIPCMPDYPRLIIPRGSVMHRVISLILLALSLPACATITSGTSQPISVISEPPGASCSLQREGSIIGIVNPTPGTIQVSKSGRDIAIRCTKAGYYAGITPLPSQFQAMAAGNILLGGVIGAAVDAATGAYAKYPETVTVVLPPETFPSALSRDEFFAARIADTRRQYEERSAKLRDTCGPSDPQECTSRLQDLDKEKDEALALLEQQRRSARVGTLS